MRLHKLKASETAGAYEIESPVTEDDILLMAKQLACLRLRKGRALTSPKEVFSHLQTLLAEYEHLDGASVYPREVVKIALQNNAAAMIFVHNHPSGDPEPSQADRTLIQRLKGALELVGVRTLDHIVVGRDGCI